MTDQPTLPTELPPSEHMHACPDPPGRTETYEVIRSDGIPVHVVHCVQCGGVAYYPKETTDGR